MNRKMFVRTTWINSIQYIIHTELTYAQGTNAVTGVSTMFFGDNSHDRGGEIVNQIERTYSPDCPLSFIRSDQIEWVRQKVGL